MKLSIKKYGTLLAKYLKNSSLHLVLLALVLAVSIILQLVNPMIISFFIDGIEKNKSMELLIKAAILFILAAFMQQLLAIASTYLSQNIGWRTTNTLRRDLVKHCLTLDMNYFKEHPSGELVERIDGDVNALFNFFSLLKVLLGLLPAQRGSISWNGKELKTPGDFLIHPHCSYTPQIPRLVSDSVRNNILFGLREEETDIKEALHRAVFEEDILQLEQGLETIIGPRGVKLSGGQIQRVAVARMFARRSSLRVFDDISSALDVETESKLWQRLFAERSATCLVVSNRRLALKQADQIVVMKDGRIDGIGTLEELLQNNEEMKAIWG
ncbi:ABC transporter ATP-binding protein [Anaerocolumna sp. AGMB13020]|uniref:ABC transporter ATP-binding protein n=1 Tax=Anaerocolumna sp. AGMB13020 TaxID=3081750 RepID=UPI00295341F4|nr:ABC transporter ATP-binding protein [Anaerocolumna sp. AGMB13020]WOO38118.1 ABC transporter ATP-binding protein [Anaerocolumna sp. AGMB13020]